MCGSKWEIDFSGAAEIKGYCIQTIDISCSNEECLVSLSVTSDFSYMKDYAGDALMDAWNSLKKE
jgi:hypothetical protein